MKKKDVSNYRAKTITELRQDIRELEKKLSEKNLERYTKQPKNSREMGITRNVIAILSTIVREKELLEDK